MEKPWHDYRSFLLERYGESVYRIAIDGGFGCPNQARCIYCDSLGSSSAYQRVQERGFAYRGELVEEIDSLVEPIKLQTMEERLDSISHQVSRGASFIDRRYPGCAKSIYFQAFTNTNDKTENLKKLYDKALSMGDYKELIVSTRPDVLSDEVLDLLCTYTSQVEEVWVELGLQSGSDATLKAIKRGHSVDDYLDACRRAKARGLKVTAHIILGLPDEGPAEYLQTAALLTSSPIDGLKIHHLQVLCGSELANLYRAGKVKAPTFQEHLEGVILILRHIPQNIVIQRLMSEAPPHRLIAPRDFGNKSVFLRALEEEMRRRSVSQGDAL